MTNIQHCSYHSHTNFSDGANTLEEMVEKAKQIGFCELGISDHLIVHKNMSASLSAPMWYKRGHEHIYNNDFKKILPAYQKHCDEIRKFSRLSGFKIYVGFEVDFFTYAGWLDELRDFLSKLDYDYLISGNHMLFDEDCQQLFDLNDLPLLYPDVVQQEEFLRRHFQVINEAVKSGVFKFLAHLDYARKLGEAICPADKFRQEKLQILDSLQKQNMPLEISTKGLRKIKDFYPCDWILTAAKERELKFVISDDAHAAAELGDRFNLAEEALRKHNIFNRLKF
ncbi:MAG: histidinol-phosphatase HisJ family protein [Pseudomonadota bacterium]|nr:histidinol-phosphatase HisJ family protein [Pseudomonadota bacterium]